MCYKQESDLLLHAARDAGGILLKHFRQDIDVREKAALDVVTEADLASEDLIRNRILAAFPDDSISAEESGRSGQSERCWHIDPLDGTVNFAHGLAEFAVCIAFADLQGPAVAAVYNPYLGQSFTAIRGCGAFLNGLPIQCARKKDLSETILYVNHHGLRKGNDRAMARVLDLLRKVGPRVQGIRNSGSMGLSLCSVACGWLDAVVACDMDYYSTPAGSLIMAEAGIQSTDLNGVPYRPGAHSLLSANPVIHAALAEALGSGGSG